MSVTVHLRGGIGNQMAIYAAGLALSRKLGVDLKLDISAYASPYEPRMYSLGLFKGVDQQLVQGLSGKIIQEKGLPYDPALFEDAPKECSIVGYFQCSRYFDELRDELGEIFKPKQHLGIRQHNMEHFISEAGDRSVFVTVRRGDYVDNDYHGMLPMQYYEKARDYVNRCVDNPYFFVFSDDPEWCAQSFRVFPYGWIIAGNLDRTVKGHLGCEAGELLLMRHCAHAIMANSSYSWWGVWLGAGKNGGVVVAPERWFGPACKESPQDIYEPGWMKL